MSPRLDEEQFERQLSRLVDGELSGVEYRQLLESLESAPDGWRRCALAFLESQALSRDLLGIGRDPAPRWSAMLAAANAPVTHEESVRERTAVGGGEQPNGRTAQTRAADPRAVDPQSGDGQAAGGRSSSVWRSSTAARWAALAASWLVVFGVGWGLSGSASREAPQRGGWRAEPPTAAVVSDPRSTGRPRDGRDSIPVRVPGGRLPGGVHEPTGSPSGNPASRPNAGDAAEQLVDTYVPPEYRLPPADIREDVRARGIDVREREMYLPLRLEDGKDYVVPVREYKVAPWQRPAY